MVAASGDEGGQDQAPKSPEPRDDAAEVVGDGGDVGGVSSAGFEIAAAEVTIGLQVSDDGLDCGAAAQLA